MNAPTARAGMTGRVVPRLAAAGRGEWLANWLALVTLLALGIIWQ
ncbi:MAG TPA: hypothetical protein VGH75_12330 [Steroidobacteraceae bacterium]